MRRTRIAIFIAASCALAGLAYVVWLVADPNCMATFIEHRACVYLRTPLVWLSPEERLTRPTPEVVSALPVPEQVTEPNEIKTIPPDQIELSRQFAGNNPGGMMGIAAAWSQQSSLGQNLFIVPQDQAFIGAMEIALFNVPSQPHTLVTCLVNFRQHPCSPGQSNVLSLDIAPDRLQQIPITLPNLQPGLNDLTVVVWSDNRALGVATDDEGRIRVTQTAFRTSIAVDGDTTPPAYANQPLPLPYHVFGLEGLAISARDHIWDEYGSFRAETTLSARAGEPVTFFLHVFNRQAMDIDWAVAGFLDYAQIPLTYRGTEHLPLYFTAKANAWYVLPVSLQAPATPGDYEFVILGQHFPGARMDQESTVYAGLANLSLDVWSTTQVVLQVGE